MTTAKALVALLLAVALAALAYPAVRWGLADLHANHARSEMERWSKSGKAPGFTQWRLALDSARTAHELDPNNPGITEEMGLLYDWSAVNQGDRDPTAIAQREEALKFFRIAARQRPTSGYTWANIALVKARLGQSDTEYFNALEAATELAPWEPAVHLIVAEAGLPNWPKLSPEVRESVRQNIARGLAWQPAEVVKIAQKYKQIAVVCSVKERSKEPIAVCKN